MDSSGTNSHLSQVSQINPVSSESVLEPQQQIMHKSDVTTEESNVITEKLPKRKKRKGDRRDGWLVRKIDPFQKTIPFLLPGRDASCIYFKETIDATNLVSYVAEKNARAAAEAAAAEATPTSASSPTPQKKYTYFHVFLAALNRTLALRPHLNRFVAGNRLYQRKKIVLGFVAKKALTEEAVETSVKVSFERDATIDDVAEKLSNNITKVKTEKSDDTTDFLNTLVKLPRFLLRIIVRFLEWLNYHGWYPKSILSIDPMHCSAFVSNLGSIGLDNVPFHHLYDRGTCSLFVVIGRIHKGHVYVPDQGFVERDVVDISITLDERVSNGFYYIKAIELYKSLIENPKLLEIKPKEVPIDD